MKHALLLFLVACTHAVPVTPAVAPPAPAPVAAVVAPDLELAPRLFDADGLRDGFVLGTRIRFRIEPAGEPAVEERWQVTGHTAEGCTIASQIHDPATGELVEDQGEGTSTWTELQGHAAFPAADTEIADDTITVPAGTFDTRRYTVRDGDAVKVMHFAKTLPGPPVSMVVTKDGQVVLTMVLLERTQP